MVSARWWIGAAALCLCTAHAHGNVIPGLFNTGVANDGTLLPDGSVDPHYTLTASPSGPGTTSVVNTSGFPFPLYIPDGPNSKWIAPHPDGRTDPEGVYRYDTTFDLAGLDPATAVITGKWSTDNDGVDILVNGVGTGFTTPALSYRQGFSDFSIGSGFISGVNTLSFLVHNDFDGTEFDPTGLRVELSGTASAIPEPTTLTFASMAILAMMGCRWRHKTASA